MEWARFDAEVSPQEENGNRGSLRTLGTCAGGVIRGGASRDIPCRGVEPGAGGYRNAIATCRGVGVGERRLPRPMRVTGWKGCVAVRVRHRCVGERPQGFSQPACVRSLVSARHVPFVDRLSGPGSIGARSIPPHRRNASSGSFRAKGSYERSPLRSFRPTSATYRPGPIRSISRRINRRIRSCARSHSAHASTKMGKSRPAASPRDPTKS